MKKILKFIRTTLIGFIWCIIFFKFMHFLLKYFWNFDIFSGQNWRLINSYWESGGVISTWKDYLLIFLLIAIIPLWIMGWKKCCKINFINLILYPYELYNKKNLEAYEKTLSKLKIKNMGTTIMKIEDEIEMKSKPKETIKTDEQVNKIRQAVAEKINSVHYNK